MTKTAQTAAGAGGFRARIPWPIYALAACFILAPLGNTVISMINAGVADWYLPSSILQWFRQMPWVVYIWISLSIAAGIGLLIPRRLTWALSIVAIVFSIGMSIYTRAHNHSHFFGLTSVSNLGILVVIYYFRFPYLDRREWWWGISPRYRCELAVRVGDFAARVSNISRSGALIEPAPPGAAPGQELEIALADVGSFPAIVARLAQTGIGVRFRPDLGQAKAIRQLVSKIAAAAN